MKHKFEMSSPILLKVDLLELDDLNPRLPEELRGGGQAEILAHIQKEYDLIRLARSISQHGFFTSEPLIAIKKGKRYIVVEGNRRLATLFTLKVVPQAGIQHKGEWDELKKSKLIPDAVPVVVAESREQVAPVIGYRHITGIEPWDPWAKARYIGWMIDDQKYDFDEVADFISESASEIRSTYRNYRLLKSAREKFKIETKPAEDNFGVFTRTMNSAPIKNFIGIKTNAQVKVGSNPVPSSSKKELEELFGWMFGDNKVVNDSRDITKLGSVIASKDGVEALRKTSDLVEAEIAAGGKKERLIKRLQTSLSNLEKCLDDYKTYKKDEKVKGLVSQCQSALARLK